jgi:DUF438 domain-containing protein
MQLSPRTGIGELLKTYPFLLDYLASYTQELRKLRNPILRNTFGRVATLRMASTMGKVPLDRLLADLQGAIATQTGERVDIDYGTALTAVPPSGVNPLGPPASEAQAETEAAGRLEILKGIIKDLHAGVPLEEAKQRFAALLEHVDPTEIAKMEQQLMADGMPQSEIKRLCDVHVQVFKALLDARERPELQPGHPVHTFLAENRALELVAERLQALLEGGAPQAALRAALDELATVERHYLRKENQLFPVLERRGIVGPPQVMWAIHDEVRVLLKEVRAALAVDDRVQLGQKGPALVQTLVDMIYKEDNILFPMSLSILEESDWVEINRGEAVLGYALVTAGDEWRPDAALSVAGQPATAAGALARLPLDTGLLSLEQVNLLLRSLPVDLSFVDENDEVRYYSEGRERIFPRSPGVIGRKVQNCHPPKSVATVNRILQEFRAGSRSVAEFWIRGAPVDSLRGGGRPSRPSQNEHGGRFLHIRYFALRDPRGDYRGCLEVTQDVTAIRALEGERRLLDWGP